MASELRLALALALAACNPGDEPSRKPDTAPAPKIDQPNRKVDRVTMTLPSGWASEYDEAHDRWRFTSPPIAGGGASSAIFERAPAASAASPEALRHHLETAVWDRGTTATIEGRAATRDGFVATFVVTTAADPAHPRRETYVMKELGNEWFRCWAPSIVDDAMRDQVVALCKSLRR